jgi:hypothetical protein
MTWPRNVEDALPNLPNLSLIQTALAVLKAERKHAEVLQDRDKIAADMRQLQSDKEMRVYFREKLRRTESTELKTLQVA